MKFFKSAVIILLLMVLGGVKSFAQSSSDLRKQREQLNQQLEQLNKDLEETSKNKKATLKQLDDIKAKIKLHEDMISNIGSSIRVLDNQISDNTNTVHSLQSQLAELKKQYAAMVLFAFHNKSAYNKLMFIFVAKDFNQAYMRLKYMQQIGSYRERQAAYITGTEKKLGQKIEELDQNKQAKNGLLKDEVNQKQKLGEARETQAKVVVDLSKHQKEVKQEQAATQRKLQKINRAVELAVRREIEEARRREEELARAEAAKAKAENKPAPVHKTPSSSSSSDVLNRTPEAIKLSSDFLSNRGRLPWPVTNGIITHPYGKILLEGKIQDDNKGVTIKTNAGASVRAVFEGDVLMVQDIEGAYLVIIRHGGYLTVYSNLRSVAVSKGQKVTTKQSIGTAATDSASGETEIGFEVHKGLDDMNPASWLAQNN